MTLAPRTTVCFRMATVTTDDVGSKRPEVVAQLKLEINEGSLQM